MTTSKKYSVHQCCDVKEYLGVNGLRQVEIDFTIQFHNMKLSEMSNLNTFGAQLTDFWPYVAKIGKYRKCEFGHLKFS